MLKLFKPTSNVRLYTETPFCYNLTGTLDFNTISHRELLDYVLDEEVKQKIDLSIIKQKHMW